jgi:hypothetical protein
MEAEVTPAVSPNPRTIVDGVPPRAWALNNGATHRVDCAA